MKSISSRLQPLKLPPWQWWVAVVATLIAALVTLGGYLLQERQYTWMALAFLAVFLCTAYLGVPAVKKAFARTWAKIWLNEEAPKSKGIILTISRLRDFDNPVKPARDCYEKALEMGRSAQTASDKLRILEELCSRDLDKFNSWPWQQSLRAIKHNWGELKSIAVIVSGQVDKENQYPPFKMLLASFLPPDVLIERVEDAVELYDFNGVSTAIEAAVKLCQKNAGCEPSEICIDITSGTATYSVAGAVKTLNSDLRFNYFQTHGEKTGEVAVYDAVIAS